MVNRLDRYRLGENKRDPDLPIVMQQWNYWRISINRLNNIRANQNLDTPCSRLHRFPLQSKEKIFLLRGLLWAKNAVSRTWYWGYSRKTSEPSHADFQRNPGKNYVPAKRRKKSGVSCRATSAPLNPLLSHKCQTHKQKLSREPASALIMTVRVEFLHRLPRWGYQE